MKKSRNELSAEHAKLFRELGQDVQYLNDHKQIVLTKVRLLPWMLGHGQWVIGLEGVPGGYDVMRVAVVIKHL